MHYGARPNECCSRSWFFWFLACTSLQAWYMTGAALVFLSVNATVYVFLGPRLATVSLIVSSIAFSFDSIIGLFTTVLPPISLALGLLLAWHLLHEVGMCVRVRVRACVCVCVCSHPLPSLLSLPAPCPPSLTLSHSCERYTIVSTPQRLVARARRRALDHVDSAPIGSLTAAFRSFEWRVPHVSFDVYCLVNQTLFPLVLTLLTVVVLFFTLPLFN